MARDDEKKKQEGVAVKQLKTTPMGPQTLEEMINLTYGTGVSPSVSSSLRSYGSGAGVGMNIRTPAPQTTPAIPQKDSVPAWRQNVMNWWNEIRRDSPTSVGWRGIRENKPPVSAIGEVWATHPEVKRAQDRRKKIEEQKQARKEYEERSLDLPLFATEQDVPGKRTQQAAATLAPAKYMPSVPEAPYDRPVERFQRMDQPKQASDGTMPAQGPVTPANAAERVAQIQKDWWNRYRELSKQGLSEEKIRDKMGDMQWIGTGLHGDETRYHTRGKTYGTAYGALEDVDYTPKQIAGLEEQRMASEGVKEAARIRERGTRYYADQVFAGKKYAADVKSVLDELKAQAPDTKVMKGENGFVVWDNKTNQPVDEVTYEDIRARTIQKRMQKRSPKSVALMLEGLNTGDELDANYISESSIAELLNDLHATDPARHAKIFKEWQKLRSKGK
jgi:hypothetical protein